MESGEDDFIWEYPDEQQAWAREMKGLKKKNTAPRIFTDTTAPRNVPKAKRTPKKNTS